MFFFYVLFGVVALLALILLVINIWIIVESFKVSSGWGVASLLCFGPLYHLAFLLSHFERAKAPVGAHYVVGFLIVGILKLMPYTISDSALRAHRARARPSEAAALDEGDDDYGASSVDSERDSTTETYTPPEPVEQPPPVKVRVGKGQRDVRDPYVMAASDDDDVRFEALRNWRSYRLDRIRNGRLKMLQVLAGRAGNVETKLILESLEAQPIALSEALACLGLAAPLPPAVREALLGRIRSAAAAGDRQEVREITEALERLPGDDLRVDEILLLCGVVRSGAVVRLVAARGVEWGRSPEGRDVLVGVLEREPVRLARLAEQGVEEQLLVVDLVAVADGLEPDDALGLLLPAVRAPDPDVSRAASQAVGTVGSLEHLLPLLRAREAAVRRAGAAAIGRQGDARATWGLARALVRERDRAVREALIAAVRSLPEAKAASFLKGLRAKRDRVDRLAAQHTARLFSTALVLPIFAAGLGDSDRRLKLDAIRALLDRAADAGDRRLIADGHYPTVYALACDPSDREVQERAFELSRALMERD